MDDERQRSAEQQYCNKNGDQTEYSGHKTNYEKDYGQRLTDKFWMQTFDDAIVSGVGVPEKPLMKQRESEMEGPGTWQRR